MYFVDVASLKSDLSAGPLPASEQLKYLLAFILPNAIASLSSISGAPAWGSLDWISWALGTAVQVGGVLACYSGNGGALGARFLERLSSLGFVVGVRWIPGGLLLILLGGFALKQLGVSDLGASVAFRIHLSAVGAIVYYATYLEFRSLDAAAA